MDQRCNNKTDGITAAALIGMHIQIHSKITEIWAFAFLGRDGTMVEWISHGLPGTSRR